MMVGISVDNRTAEIMTITVMTAATAPLRTEPETTAILLRQAHMAGITASRTRLEDGAMTTEMSEVGGSVDAQRGSGAGHTIDAAIEVHGTTTDTPITEAVSIRRAIGHTRGTGETDLPLHPQAHALSSAMLGGRQLHRTLN